MNITDPIFHNEAKALAHIEARYGRNKVMAQIRLARVRQRVGFDHDPVIRNAVIMQVGRHFVGQRDEPVHRSLLAGHLLALALGRLLGLFAGRDLRRRIAGWEPRWRS